MTAADSEPITYSCPSCGAKYRIVAIDSPGGGRHGKVTCLSCDALFPAGDERGFFKYILVGRPNSNGKRRRVMSVRFLAVKNALGMSRSRQHWPGSVMTAL
jgi:predicted Zn finger-like uncharacterized protein